MKKITKINKDVLIGELIETYPELGDMLVNDYNFHCIGCLAAHEETLEEGATVHGMNKKEIESLVKKLNETLEGRGKDK